VKARNALVALGCLWLLSTACTQVTSERASAFPLQRASVAVAAETPNPPSLAELIGPIVENAVKQQGWVGAIVGVRLRAGPPYIAAFGSADIQGSVPAAPSSAHPIASVTKQFTAAAVMQLVERGRIALDDPLSAYLSDTPSVWRNVTVRHLLNHTSGIVEPGDINLVFQTYFQAKTPMDVVAAVKRLAREPVFEPGSHHEYSNFGYLLLGAIIESASGVTYGQYLQANIFEPLGLDDTQFAETFPSSLWPGYVRENGRLVSATPVQPALSFSAGGIVSTAADLIAWQQALAGGRVVSPDSYRQMITPTRLASGEDYPYGFGALLVALHCQDGVRHDGGMPGYETVLLYCPQEDVAIVLMFNSNPTDPTAIHGLLTQLSRALLEKD
jgi:D-alanyl-D-alanine carboxypeptidase